MRLDGIVFALIAYLLLLPILTLAPIKLTFMHKALVSACALLLTILCVLAGNVIPLYQVIIIFSLLLLLSSYFLETRLKSIFIHSSKTSDNHFTTKGFGTIEKDRRGEMTLPHNKSAPSVNDEEAREDHIEELFPHTSPEKIIDSPEEDIEEKVVKEISESDFPPLSKLEDATTPLYESEWDDLERQFQLWDPPSKQKDIKKDKTMPSNTVSSKEEEEYNRLFSEVTN
jgi:hypothetical protein